MHTILSILAVLLITCGQKQGAEQSAASTKLFTLAEAEKILGEPATLGNNTEGFDGASGFHNIDYTAKDTDRVSGKLGAIYLLLQSYKTSAGAIDRYRSTKKANENHGIQTLNDIGDEAYFHSDNENFLFIMIRKDMKVLTMKVNKITSKTSESAFRSVAQSVLERL